MASSMFLFVTLILFPILARCGSPININLGDLTGTSVLGQLANSCSFGELCQAVSGRSTTGFNRVLGQALYNFSPFTDQNNAKFGYETIGQYPTSCPGVTCESITFTTSSKNNTLIATHVPAELYSTFARLVVPGNNVRLGDEPVRLNGAASYGSLNNTFEWTNLDPSRSTNGERLNDLTIGQWLLANGHGLFRCNSAIGNYVELWFDKLVPDALYQVQGVWFNQPVSSLVWGPLAGAGSSSFSTDEVGNGRFVRRIAYCPLLPSSPSIPTLVALDISLISSGELNGVTAVNNALPGNIQGVSTHTHVTILVNGRVYTNVWSLTI